MLPHDAMRVFGMIEQEGEGEGDTHCRSTYRRNGARSLSKIKFGSIASSAAVFELHAIVVLELCVVVVVLSSRPMMAWPGV